VHDIANTLNLIGVSTYFNHVLYLIFGLNMILSLNFKWILELVKFEILDQFSHLSYMNLVILIKFC